jgi:uroporphyrinogen decarboxylase
MRQAGRALPEYRELKEQYTFVELVRNPELAAEVTLQPIRRFGFDAAVLFSDILVVPESMGQPYHFRETGGIEMEFAIQSADDIRRLSVEGAVERLSYVRDALTLLKRELKGQTALLGFAGSPWTLANYMINGGSLHESTLPQTWFDSEPRLFEELMQKLTRVVTEFLQMQIEAGADALQIFDSNGGQLADHVYEAASGRWIGEIIAGLKGQVPVIVFCKGALAKREALLRTGANVLSVDWTQPLAELRALLPANVGLQGNLDPVLLTTTPEMVVAETNRILRELAPQPGHIFNLGHGVLPNSKLECIEALVKTVRQFRN